MTLDTVSGAQFGIALLAGVLATFSPCVLPALPMVAAASLSSSRAGPLALALGLVTVFTGLGALVAAAGAGSAADPALVRGIASLLLGFAGLVLLIDPIQDWISNRLTRFTNASNRLADRLPSGLFGQFLLGGILGAIWSPCTGPLLGAAISLAATQESRWTGIALMAAFSLGSAIPLLALSYGSLKWIQKSRGQLMVKSKKLKRFIGGMLLVVSLMIVTGLDKAAESRLLDILPEKWLEWITRF